MSEIDKRQARRMQTMVDSGLIAAEHVHPWTDQVIIESDDPPGWVIDLAGANSQLELGRAISEYVQSPPFEEFDPHEVATDHLSCLLLLHEAGQMSWTDFLAMAEEFARDGNQTGWDPAVFGNPLQQLKADGDGAQAAQQAEIRSQLTDGLARVEPEYEQFKQLAG